MRRRTDDQPDDVSPAVRGLVIGLAIIALATALAALMLPARAQTLVSVDRTGYTTGRQHVECWLSGTPAAAVYATGTLVVDCHDDMDGIYTNGFEGAT